MIWGRIEISMILSLPIQEGSMFSICTDIVLFLSKVYQCPHIGSALRLNFYLCCL